MSKAALYWTLWTHEDWQMVMAASPHGLCYVGAPGEEFQRFAEWANRFFPDHLLVEEREKLKNYISQYNEYIHGKRTRFSIPVQLCGTSFQQMVWQALRQLDYGQTVSYSEIAKQIGHPSAYRAVGRAIGANPLLIVVPCHRVIGKNGLLTGFRGGIEMKRKLLDLENGGDRNQYVNMIK
jgi:methylated-DNA-[protein]-cysteine S-methyltransferase